MEFSGIVNELAKCPNENTFYWFQDKIIKWVKSIYEDDKSIKSLFTNDWYYEILELFVPLIQCLLDFKDEKLESPIEKEFARRILRHESNFKDGVRLGNQYVVNTTRSLYRVDFVLFMRNKKIGIECDGKDYHNFKTDLVRDSIILGEEKLDTIYRIGGKDINFAEDDSLLAISLMEPNLFENNVHNMLPLEAGLIEY